MKNIWICCFFLVLLSGCSASNFPAEKAELKGFNILHGINTDAIVRDYDTHLHLIDESKASLTVKRAVTILNEEGRDKGFLTLHYDSFREIKELSGAIYNANGKLVRNLTDADLRDFPATSSWSLYEDNRVKIAELYHNEYPYTVIYEYKIAYNGLLNLPTWYPQDEGEFVENASLKIQNLSNVKAKAVGLETKVSKSKIRKDSVYTWRVKNLEPIKNEPLDPPFFKKVPHVLIGAQNFRMANTSGNMSSWENFGRWYFSLSNNLDQLSEKTISEVKTIFNSASSRREGIEKLYEYMQSKTRYVSVQLGIGGWKPFSAKYVDQKGYGDCKALTNYMHSILKIVNVPSYPVLIRSGYNAPALETGFPSNQFNHVILYVPEGDPVWLESTSQTLPFNYISNSNSDRYGLLIKPDSSFLIKTPTYDFNTNKLKNDIKIDVQKEGNAKISLKSTYSGAYLDEVIQNTAQKSDKLRKRWLRETIDLNGFKLLASDFSDIDEKRRESTVYVDIMNSNYATRTGSRLFIPLNKINRWPYQFAKIEGNRKYDVNLPFSFEETDHSIISLPKGYKVESYPRRIQKEADFGSFSLEITENEEGMLDVYRNLKITQTHFGPENYGDLRDFFVEISNMDNKNIILRSE